MQAAYGKGLFGSDAEVLWKSGVNLYIMFDKQDKSKSGKVPPNEHPVKLEAVQIANALQSMEFWTKGGIFKRKEATLVFSTQQANLLGNYLAQGLSRATPDQDIIFVLSKLKKGTFGLSDRVYMGGRAFYQNGRLNIIIGEYDRPADKGRENVDSSAGVETQYYIEVGKRGKASGFVKQSLITGNGVDVYTESGKQRRDWFVIDVGAASAAYVARTEGKDKNAGGADAEAIRQEAARMAQERREMRAEMARMRKEINETKEESGGAQLSVEERLSRLEELHNKKLITDDEYNQKRKEILNDI